MTLRISIFGTLVFAGACGCAGRPPAAPADRALPTISLRLPGDLRQVTVDGARIFGPSIEIEHVDDSYRGHAFAAPVDLRASDDVIQGAVGGRTELHLEVRTNGFAVRGMNAGKLGFLEVEPDRVAGQVGGCGYDLNEPIVRGSVYRGYRACAEHLEPAELSFAPELATMAPEDRAALLAILLVP
jgi:hypothetical protein